ncbi:MAG: hypothetical protein ACTHMB_07875, partial [Candidatus Binatia bacterium]
KISQQYFNRQSNLWRDEQSKLSAQIAAQQNANISYIDSGVKILELAQRAVILYETQSMQEKRRILHFVLSNSVWKDDRLEPVYKKPFDFLAENNWKAQRRNAGSRMKKALLKTGSLSWRCTERFC